MAPRLLHPVKPIHEVLSALKRISVETPRLVDVHSENFEGYVPVNPGIFSFEMHRPKATILYTIRAKEVAKSPQELETFIYSVNKALKGIPSVTPARIRPKSEHVIHDPTIVEFEQTIPWTSNRALGSLHRKMLDQELELGEISKREGKSLSELLEANHVKARRLWDSSTLIGSQIKSMIEACVR